MASLKEQVNAASATHNATWGKITKVNKALSHYKYWSSIEWYKTICIRVFHHQSRQNILYKPHSFLWVYISLHPIAKKAKFLELLLRKLISDLPNQLRHRTVYECHSLRVSLKTTSRRKEFTAHWLLPSNDVIPAYMCQFLLISTAGFSSSNMGLKWKVVITEAACLQWRQRLARPRNIQTCSHPDHVNHLRIGDVKAGTTTQAIYVCM